MEELGVQEEMAQASSSLGCAVVCNVWGTQVHSLNAPSHGFCGRSASNKLFLGGLSWVTTEGEPHELFLSSMVCHQASALSEHAF